MTIHTPAKHVFNRVAATMLTGFAKVGKHQAFEKLFDRFTDKDKLPGAACALGALALGDKANWRVLTADEATDYWPTWAPHSNYVPCPAHRERLPDTDIRCDWAPDYIISITTHLNDEHRWSIPRIANWIASLDAPADG